MTKALTKTTAFVGPKKWRGATKKNSGAGCADDSPSYFQISSGGATENNSAILMIYSNVTFIVTYVCV